MIALSKNNLDIPKTECTLCSNHYNEQKLSMSLFIDDIYDFEYGVQVNRNLYRCDECGLVSIYPRFNSSDLESLYPEKYGAYQTKSSSKSIFSFIKKILNVYEVKKVTQHIPNNGTLLEVGCGNGLFLEEVHKIRPDIKLIGFDIKDSKHINRNYIDFHLGEFEYFNEINFECDLIYFSNLIEHVIDPQIFIQKCKNSLKEKGKIFGITPCHDSIDRIIFGKYWGGYHFPRHINIFNSTNLPRLFKICGFKQTSIYGTYGFWYVSLANRLIKLNGYKKRGILFFMCSIFFLPFDFIINLFRISGSMTFIAEKN